MERDTSRYTVPSISTTCSSSSKIFSKTCIQAAMARILPLASDFLGNTRTERDRIFDVELRKIYIRMSNSYPPPTNCPHPRQSQQTLRDPSSYIWMSKNFLVNMLNVKEGRMFVTPSLSHILHKGYLIQVHNELDGVSSPPVFRTRALLIYFSMVYPTSSWLHLFSPS